MIGGFLDIQRAFSVQPRGDLGAMQTKHGIGERWGAG